MDVADGVVVVVKEALEVVNDVDVLDMADVADVVNVVEVLDVVKVAVDVVVDVVEVVDVVNELEEPSQKHIRLLPCFRLRQEMVSSVRVGLLYVHSPVSPIRGTNPSCPPPVFLHVNPKSVAIAMISCSSSTKLIASNVPCSVQARPAGAQVSSQLLPDSPTIHEPLPVVSAINTFTL
eukprot:gnl/MRDRNA2_/MRDRNA2_72483_c0_seq2.p2 gnl/MRDRNA2_/MRDRNA2_72483_c0~~gnl/MRDRNA2_/MRDRNA2_72483_c0_seq2.p2  ORF type:complete len:178 (-),score=27.77 gnl/MRDRNA2_/MRDRNA2_72483_c0_seq2:91-624(-)